MAIGVSPCPPFVKPCGVPGVIFDGNTAAWFDTSSPQHVVKDGANRVSYLFDKIGYGIGAELVNQATWYTLAYWDLATPPNWSQVGNTLVSDGNSGVLRKTGFLAAGLVYEVRVSVIRNAGTIYPFYDAGTAAPAPINATGNYTYYVLGSLSNIVCNSVLFDGSVTMMSCKQVAGNHLIQLTGASQPLWSANGVLFDGVNDFMKCTAFALVQPEFIYFVGRQITWSNIINCCTYDGNIVNSMLLYDTGISPSEDIYAGVGVSNNTWILNTFMILRSLYNGAASMFRVNNGAAVNGNVGANNAGGFTLGAAGSNVQWKNMEVKEIILRRTADNAAVQTSIYNYLANKYAI
jgi:hypothetical protein